VGWRDFVVDRVVPESESIKSFYLKPEDDRPIMPFKPGQYLTFQLDTDAQGTVVRNYSVSSAPGRDYYRISVKREMPPADAPEAPPGLASNQLHDHVRPGATVRASAPAGDFFLADGDGRPIVLFSGGVGLTPMVSMLDSMVDRGLERPVWYVHAAVSGRVHAMKQHVREVTSAHDAIRSVVFYEFPAPQDVRGEDYDFSGRITMDWVKHAVPVPEADFYFCGPKGFMRLLNLGLRAIDVPEDRIHFEFFGPAQDLLYA
jgi:nitric oxide dioxygenase